MDFELKSPEIYHPLTKKLQYLVDKGEFAGSLCLVSRKGVIEYYNKFGLKDIEQNIPIEFNDILWIASLT